MNGLSVYSLVPERAWVSCPVQSSLRAGGGCIGKGGGWIERGIDDVELVCYRHRRMQGRTEGKLH